MRLLLDANPVLKRYVAEPGSDVVETIYRAADAGRVQLVCSLWTLGECLGVLDRLQPPGLMPPGGAAAGRAARAATAEGWRLLAPERQGAEIAETLAA